MKRKILLGIVTLFFVVGCASIQTAKEQPFSTWSAKKQLTFAINVYKSEYDKYMAAVVKPNLTDDQKARIAEIIRSHRAEILGAVKALREEQRALVQQVRAEEVDERAIRRAALGMADAIADASVLRARVRKQVREVLTPGQRRKVDECLEDIDASVDRFVGGLGTQNQ